MRTYEITIALHPDLGEAGVKEQVEKVSEIISSNEGSVKQVAEWGLRDLAYPIKKEKRAIFQVVVFEGNGAIVAELERNLRISDHALRYITIRVDPDRPPLEIGRPRRDPESGTGEDGEGAAPAEAAAEEQKPAAVEAPTDAPAAS
ncbi:MAG: 30S ribosomal protein S6 [Candidatus Binatia bacterium]|nr:30S ribosomal protein S6 [Candidatus Binatia bacterium]